MYVKDYMYPWVVVKVNLIDRLVVVTLTGGKDYLY